MMIKCPYRIKKVNKFIARYDVPIETVEEYMDCYEDNCRAFVMNICVKISRDCANTPMFIMAKPKEEAEND